MIGERMLKRDGRTSKLTLGERHILFLSAVLFSVVTDVSFGTDMLGEHNINRNVTHSIEPTSSKY